MIISKTDGSNRRSDLEHESLGDEESGDEENEEEEEEDDNIKMRKGVTITTIHCCYLAIRRTTIVPTMSMRELKE